MLYQAEPLPDAAFYLTTFTSAPHVSSCAPVVLHFEKWATTLCAWIIVRRLKIMGRAVRVCTRMPAIRFEHWYEAEGPAIDDSRRATGDLKPGPATAQQLPASELAYW